MIFGLCLLPTDVVTGSAAATSQDVVLTTVPDTAIKEEVAMETDDHVTVQTIMPTVTSAPSCMTGAAKTFVSPGRDDFFFPTR